MVSRRRRRRKSPKRGSSDGKSDGVRKKVEISFPEDLIMAVKYLLEKGFNSREVADRLEISPYTVRSIKRILRKRGLLATDSGEGERARRAERKRTKDVIEELLSG